jgi:hypothetical protein
LAHCVPDFLFGAAWTTATLPTRKLRRLAGTLKDFGRKNRIEQIGSRF